MARKNSGSSLFFSLFLILVLVVQSNAARRPRQLGDQNGMTSTEDKAVAGKKEEAKSNYGEMKNLPPFPFPFPDMPFSPPLQLPPLPFTPPLQLPPLPFTPPFGVPSAPPFAGFPFPPFPFPPIPFLTPPPL
ncbi:hypothetical protein HRI_001529800 [Hibiscus trionum]|uniref:Proline-rich protein n=1 Tax=Hibiscus trionum TaxID=183268 RepID=A0A9W7LXH8_HIBTR|nr:hypothetical protein HRI_001529800 [Hibiscus trionum]